MRRVARCGARISRGDIAGPCPRRRVSAKRGGRAPARSHQAASAGTRRTGRRSRSSSRMTSPSVDPADVAFCARRTAFSASSGATRAPASKRLPLPATTSSPPGGSLEAASVAVAPEVSGSTGSHSPQPSAGSGQLVSPTPPRYWVVPAPGPSLCDFRLFSSDSVPATVRQPAAMRSPLAVV